MTRLSLRARSRVRKCRSRTAGQISSKSLLRLRLLSSSHPWPAPELIQNYKLRLIHVRGMRFAPKDHVYTAKDFEEWERKTRRKANLAGFLASSALPRSRLRLKRLSLPAAEG